MFDLNFYKNKKVLVTGHTGFKGSWICTSLLQLGAEVIGYSLEPSMQPNLFYLANLEKDMRSIIGDVRDFNKLQRVINDNKPEIIIHLAAQPIVRESYSNPLYTYETNIMGTINILECVRLSDSVKSFLNVTTDKVYENKEWVWGYRENENLDGFDPYSNSKSCSELVTRSYKRSFLENMGIGISTARAGNVIGGGDFSKDRIIPDCIKAAFKGKSILVRNPDSIRPYQHVLEPIFAYLLIVEKQYNKLEYADTYNVGPNDRDCVNTRKLVELFCEKWGEQQKWKIISEKNAPHESNFLKLDCSKIKNTLGWEPLYNIETAIDKTVEWSKYYKDSTDVNICMKNQITEYINLLNGNGD